MTASEKFQNSFSKGKHICVGLDTDIKKIPEFLLKKKNPVVEFNSEIIEATKNAAAAYKINLAFYEELGSEGVNALHETIRLIPDEIPIIGDAKRGDIGNTAEKYARTLFDFYGFDAATINPLMGFDSAAPFIKHEDKINFVLALTSNSGAEDFEKLKLDNGKFLYQEIIEKCSDWGKNIGFVFGATKLDELQANLELLGDAIVLLPGVGAQGGSLEETVKVFSSAKKNNFIINISRGLIYLGSTKLFAEKTRNKIELLNKQVADLPEIKDGRKRKNI